MARSIASLGVPATTSCNNKETADEMHLLYIAERIAGVRQIAQKDMPTKGGGEGEGEGGGGCFENGLKGCSSTSPCRNKTNTGMGWAKEQKANDRQLISITMTVAVT